MKTFNGKTTNTELTDHVSYRENDFLLLGLSQQKTDVDYITTSNTNHDESFENKAIFLTNSNHLGKNFILTESMRHDKYNKFDNKTTGKLGLLYTSDFGLTLGGNYGTAYNTPNIIQILNPWGDSNAGLQPEEIKSYDLSIGYKDFKLTYFNQKIDNMISWYDPGTPFNFGDDYNINLPGTSKINGIEVAYNYTFFNTIALSMNYTRLIRAEDKDKSKLKRRAEENFKIALDYYGVKNLHLGVDAEYVGSRTDTGFDPITFKSFDVETGKYTVVNLTTNYDISPQFQVYAKIENVTDKYYQTVYGYATSPRAFSLGLKANF